MGASVPVAFSGVPPVRVVGDPVRTYLPPQYWRKKKDHFSYSVEYNTIAAGAQAAAQTFAVQADSDFLCLALGGTVATTAAGTAEQTFWHFTVRISDSGSGASWLGGQANGFTHLSNIFGRSSVDGQGLHELRVPRFVPASSEVTVELTNLDAANLRRVWLTFEGVKIFKADRS